MRMRINCREYSNAYVSDEEMAKKGHKGIWQGDFQVPAEWRKEKRERARAEKDARNTTSDAASSSKQHSLVLMLWPLLIESSRNTHFSGIKART